ncbi:MAG: hypothetical protein KJN82_02365 [Bacteroidia bacterium]|nr:hypothetical protein [Bacteroidia bacterium]
MNGQVNFTIFKNLKLILVNYLGDISIEVINTHIEKLSSDKDYNPNYNTIADLRYSNILLNQSNLPEVINKIIDNDKIIGERKQTFIIGTDNQLALSSLFSMLLRHLPMATSIVKSVREALEWVELELKHQELIEETLKKDFD